MDGSEEGEGQRRTYAASGHVPAIPATPLRAGSLEPVRFKDLAGEGGYSVVATAEVPPSLAGTLIDGIQGPPGPWRDQGIALAFLPSGPSIP
jgi:hypothetical protein